MIKELRYVPSTPVASLSSCIKNEVVGWQEVAHGNFCTTGTSVIEVLAFVWDSGKLRSLVNHINWHYTIWRLTEFSKCHNNSSSLVPQITSEMVCTTSLPGLSWKRRVLLLPQHNLGADLKHLEGRLPCAAGTTLFWGGDFGSVTTPLGYRPCLNALSRFPIKTSLTKLWALARVRVFRPWSWLSVG